MRRSQHSDRAVQWLRASGAARLQAGVDVLAIAHQPQYDPDIAAKTIAIVKKLLHEGKLIPPRIDESYTCIVKFKERLGKVQEGRLFLHEINMKVKAWIQRSLLRRDTEFLRTNATNMIGAREREAWMVKSSRA